MHIPDGFLSVSVWAALDVAAAPAVSLCVRRSRQTAADSRIPLLGVMGAFVFAAQMINFPVGIGTSGHLVGGALLAVTLGPSAGCVVMTAILAIQALVFQDGGLLALGANVFNMAVCGVLAGYLPYAVWGSGGWRRFAVFLGGVLSVLTSALLAIGELLLSGVRMPAAILGVSFGLFLISALLEGAITLAVVQALESMNGGLVWGPSSSRRYAAAALVGASIVLAAVGVLIASSLPDGLEALAGQAGFAERAKTLLATPFADYQAAFVQADWLRKTVAGLAGLTLIYGLCTVLGRWISRRGNA